ncbi:MAG: carboxypeptidase M32 [Pseudomonadota bacterium]
MTPQTAYTDLMAFARETRALAAIAGRTSWDQETMMPRHAAPQRAEEMAALEGVLHARRTDPRVGAWLAAAQPAGEVEAAQLRLLQREFDRSTKVPADLAAELARVTSLAQGIWADARAAKDFKAFAPTLERVLELRRQEADALSDGSARYDALLQDYEPGVTAADLDAMFGALRPRLIALRERILGSERPAPALRGPFDEDVQMRLTSEIAGAFGYDFNHGRIDKAVHPFSSGSGLDVRITTRTSAEEPLGSIYSTIHEVGHAAYEQGIDRAYVLTPLGQGVSMGVHESQSRIYENQLGRSAAFTGWLYGRMRASFGEIGVAGPQDFTRAVNRVETGFIRTEADEVHYNLHVLLRFDLERALISGALQVADLEEAWNERFARDFGLQVDHAANGVLQDVHWSVGLFGYFPTYTLGNVYAGCLFAALTDALPDWDADLARGDPSRLTEWLRDNLQRHGGLREPRATIEAATGRPVSEAPLLDYLDAKFGALYGL